jgi:hypothetical protein
LPAVGSVRVVNGRAAVTSADTQRAARDVRRVRGIGADARDRCELDQLAEDPLIARPQVRQHAIVDHYFPPSIEST